MENVRIQNQTMTSRIDVCPFSPPPPPIPTNFSPGTAGTIDQANRKVEHDHPVVESRVGRPPSRSNDAQSPVRQPKPRNRGINKAHSLSSIPKFPLTSTYVTPDPIRQAIPNHAAQTKHARRPPKNPRFWCAFVEKMYG